MMVVTRFAPSPTGYLHIGGARTALFNWLFAKHHGGKFLLRIEDTDRVRSTREAVDAIFDSLKWLGLEWDGEPVFQFARASRHAEVARDLVKKGKAYYCYCSPEELEEMREQARLKNLPPRYDGRWRDRDLREAPQGVDPVIRFKAPQTGQTLIQDLVQGPVNLDNAQLDDMVLLRADGTPTYMLSVVVDDHDMDITHIIRGDDHLTNAFRQYHLYQACGWKIPEFAHIPLIHGPDGSKLSKRHGAIGAETYRDLGYLPETMRNYLLRLGWAHGDDEIISTGQAIEWFDLPAVGRSPARLDPAKLNHLNGHYIREADDVRLVELVVPFIEQPLSEKDRQRFLAAMPGLKQRASTLTDLAASSLFYFNSPDFHTLQDRKAQATLTEQNKKYLETVIKQLKDLEIIDPETVEKALRRTAEDLGISFGNLASPLRVALTGQSISPSLFDVIPILGKDECLKRMESFIRA